MTMSAGVRAFLVVVPLLAPVAAAGSLGERVSVDVADAPSVSIHHVRVSERDGETVISGRVRRLGVYPNPFSGSQVVADATYPDGSTRHAEDRTLTRTPQARAFQKVHPAARFRIVIPDSLPPGTTVTLHFRGPLQGARQ